MITKESAEKRETGYRSLSITQGIINLAIQANLVVTDLSFHPLIVRFSPLATGSSAVTFRLAGSSLAFDPGVTNWNHLGHCGKLLVEVHDAVRNVRVVAKCAPLSWAKVPRYDRSPEQGQIPFVTQV
jgi:hypothetical protein